VSLSRGDVCLSCPGAVELGVLLPHLARVIVEEVAVAAGLLLVMARARAPEAACPKCGTVSGRVHSRYSRRLADAAIGGRQVEILLAVRRFFCPAPGCRRRTFAEQVDGLTVRYARKTPLLTGMLGSIAVALAGRAGSRQRYDRAATWQELIDGRWKAPRASKLDPFKAYLDRHASQGHGSFTRLFREIRDLGYGGSYSVVRNYLDQIRPARTPLPEAPPTVRDVTNWLTRRPDSLTEDEKPRLTAILDRCPELQTASDQVRAFAGMLTELTGQDLPQWIADASDAGVPGISSFAKGLKQDLDALTNGMTMPWSSGPVEGRVNHIKMIKRQMFGRAGLPLLRKRVLLTARS